MSYAVKYKTNKGEEEMKKRRVAKLIALSMVAATLLTGVNVQAKEEKVVTAMTSIDLTPELCDPVKSGPDFRLYEMIYDPLVRYGENGEINKIMQPFYMIDKSRTRKAGGAGLGLALCSEIARLHGARLQIESESRKGTCVSIIFDKKGETE